ncbi:type II toxin-antitoxin system RelE family toxin [Nakamurella lactea]|jgi:mRNA interferase RelE/StbE|uniref:type II toxin-antitoxin system RelE family toxin n=1 Tax=Nakamurella lactea TaxID=459515 RepID=UPI00041A9F5C|nr:type II toxin-antitoxin system RelE/ParE family toxin [Nakamurella lactea]
MAYRVEIRASAAKTIAALQRPQARRISDAIRGLADDPRPHGAIKMSGADAYRLRVGNYRIIYTIRDDIVTVTVTKVGHRREVYRR